MPSLANVPAPAASPGATRSVQQVGERCAATRGSRAASAQQATFGASATPGGSFDNCQGDAVASGGSVVLETSVVGPAVRSIGRLDVNTSGNRERTLASGREGVLGATAYGSGPDARPAGIFGLFNARFTDGAAAGPPPGRTTTGALRDERVQGSGLDARLPLRARHACLHRRTSGGRLTNDDRNCSVTGDPDMHNLLEFQQARDSCTAPAGQELSSCPSSACTETNGHATSG